MFTIATAPKPAAQALLQDGLSLLQPHELLVTLQFDQPDWMADWTRLAASWDRLAPDAHLKDGGHYRKRRHACFIQDITRGELTQTAHREIGRAHV